jgi:hypothetical protein
MLTSSLIALVLFMMIGALVWGAEWYVRAQKLERILSRSSLSEDSIYERYYADSGVDKNAILGAWNEISVALKIPSGKLRPNDRFGRDIGWRLIVTDELDGLFEEAHRRLRRLSVSTDFTKIYTVDQYVRLLGPHM